ncbi:RDD family protein [Mitsuaria sp. GD03876]|uniref:RDD family protein n=1 Tax=Mitsuaria sp. GD03876 TaxID=2975399 RepID=UPI0024488B88|nr:RDD family protein [Mitsuaria sp. GD03876]MDH0867447.1 RDD family protein [Mitsuaria sp. GD03876]
MTTPVDPSPAPGGALPAVPAAPAPLAAATSAGEAPAPLLAPVRKLLEKRAGGTASGTEAGEDPRDWITPEDLNVAPALLGLPLASPWQRAKAMAVDVTLVTLLSNLGNTPLLAGCCWVAWRCYKRQRASRGEVQKESGWLGWAPALCLVAFGLYSSVMEHIDEQTRSERREAVAAASPTKPDHDDEESAAEEAGPHDAAAASDSTKQLVKAALATAAIAASASPVGTEAERIEHARELERQAQRTRIKALKDEVRELKAEAKRSLLEKLRHWWELVGLNLAWAFVYFVAFPLIWPGQTPGKRLMGLRIVELTGKPLKPMLCVRRYGGYAAGATTGGMGFLQILWDANRQGLHDKAAHTAVIDTRNPRRLRLTEDLTG